MARELEPPPSRVELVDKPMPHSIWTTWLNNLYEIVRELVVDEVQKTAFGEQSTAESTPIIQTDFTYNINPEIWDSHLNGGTVTVDQHRLKLSTGAAANQAAYILSRVPIKYSAGQGALIRFSGIFTQGIVGSTQLIGVGDIADGFAFAYVNNIFGVLRVSYGHPEIQTLTIGTASSTAENVTVTLDSIAVSVPVTASGNVTTTANEIAAFDYSLIGQGWLAHAEGDEIVFQNFRAVPRVGTFSISGSTVVGSFVQTLAGVLSSQDFIPQASWNGDKMTGTLDTTKGNIYQIKYQWLGYGPIRFSIEDEETGKFVLVHTIKYNNKNVLPSINNPTLPLVYFVENIANTSDITVMSGSIAGFIEGKDESNGVRHGAGGSKLAITANTETPILTLHNPVIYEGVPNRVSIRLKFVNVSVDGNKNAILRAYRNSVLTDASFSEVDASSSVGHFDTAATNSTGGDLLFSIPLAKADSKLIPFSNDKFELRPNDFLTFTIQSSNATDGSASINYEDLF